MNVIKDCPTCEKRLELLGKLNLEAKKDSNYRERIRNKYSEALSPECPNKDCNTKTNNILGSKGETYNFNTGKWTSHTHTCPNCGRIPKGKQVYEGEATSQDFEEDTTYPFTHLEGEGIPSTNHYIEWVRTGKTYVKPDNEVVM